MKKIAVRIRLIAYTTSSILQKQASQLIRRLAKPLVAVVLLILQFGVPVGTLLCNRHSETQPSGLFCPSRN